MPGSALPPVLVELRASISEFKAKMGEAAGEVKKTAAEIKAEAAKVEAEVDKIIAKEAEAAKKAGSEFDSSARKAQLMAEKQTESTSKSHHAFSALSTVGKAALFGIAGAAVAVGGESVKMAAEFGESTAQLQGHAGISAQAAKQIGQAFLNTGFDSTFSAQQMMTAYAPVAGQLGMVAGHALNTAQSMQFMDAATQLAEASGGDLNTTAASLAATMQAYGIQTSGAAGASNMLFNVARATNTPIGTLAQTVDRLKGRLGTLAPSLQDVGTLMMFPQVASQGSRGAMLVNTSLQTLLGGSKATQKQLDALGVHLYDASGKFVGMRSVIQQLQPSLAKMSDAQRNAAEKTLFGASAAQLMGAVMSDGVSGYDKAAGAVRAVGAAHDAAEASANSLAGQMKKLKSGAEDLAVKLGQALIPILEQVMSVVGRVVTWLEKHKAVAIVLAAVIGGVLVAAMAAFVVSLFTAEGALAFVIGPIGLVIAAVALLAAGAYELATHWSEVWGWIKSVASAAGRFLGRVWDDIKNVAKTVWSDLLGFFKQWWPELLGIVTGGVGLVVGLIIQHWSQITQFTSNLWHDVTGFFTRMWSDVTGAVNTGVSDVVNWFEQLPGRVLGAIEGLATDLYNFGSHIIQMLINGVENMAGNLASAVGGVVKGALSHLPGGSLVTGALGDLGIHLAEGGFVNKPTFALVGEAGPELVLPLSDPQRMTELLAPLMSGTAPSNPTAAAFAAAAGTPTPNKTAAAPTLGTGGPSVTVVAQTDADPHRIAVEVGWALRQHILAAR